ncbi:barstar family protein [Gilliamella sp. ESL0254]|uniref:barstar family protein n=1 Tax=Gilliamella sp. ESL0254 TaxID=2705035 RepID=UPI0015807046|nr:barstar family protein [Gilliamella sp. ESL0254]NUF26965.1 barstar family protein [Gilliamella sp. ESL0254]
MKNQIIHINKEQENQYIEKLNFKNYYIAKIDGSIISTTNDYMNAIIVAFQFPSGIFSNTTSIDAYNDWMRDLTWIDQYDGYILVIENFTKMMSCYPKEKDQILNEFDETIFPFWAEEVTHTVVEGKTKGFIVLLVE